MAWFTYKCNDHGIFRVSLEKRAKKHNCPECNKESQAVLRVGSTQVMERLDNGAMARSVERLHNIEEIMEKRADDHTKEVMKKLGDEDYSED